MNKQGPGKIEWCDWTWNPITGCSNDCTYCWARGIAKRFHRSFVPTFHMKRLTEPLDRKKPAIIFACSMGEFFDDALPANYRSSIMQVMSRAYWHQFVILTKQPRRVQNFRHYNGRIPENVWIGVSVDGIRQETLCGINTLRRADVPHRILCAEPFLQPYFADLYKYDWLIIGGLTGNRGKQSGKGLDKGDVDILRRCAEKAGTPVFVKDNAKYPEKIQERPTAMASLILQREMER